MQLVVTTAIGAFIMHLGRDLVKSHPALCTGMLFTSMAMGVGMMCIFSCRPDLLRTSPQNYCILVAFTVAESVIVGFDTFRLPDLHRLHRLRALFVLRSDGSYGHGLRVLDRFHGWAFRFSSIQDNAADLCRRWSACVLVLPRV